MAVTVYAFLSIAASPYPALGNSESSNLIELGAQDLQRENFERALQLFEKAARVDPTDSQAIFFQGVAMNRLERPDQAFERLQGARQMGAIHPDLGFEIGWSLLNLRRFTEAIVELEQYEQRFSGRGQTSEFLGRAYYALGNYELAESLLQEAMGRDPALTSTARLFLALVAQAREDQKAIARHLSSMLEDSPDSPLSRRLQEQFDLQVDAAREAASPYRLILSTAGGYNDNVVALGKGVNLPADISQKDAAFVRSSLDGSYAWAPTQADTLIAGYRFLSIVYEGLPNFDLIDHFFYLDYRHGFAPNLTGTFRLSDEFTQVGGRNFRNQVGLRPALLWRPFNWNVIEIAYGAFIGDYFFPTTTVLDRNGQTHTVAVTNFFSIPGVPFEGRLGYFHIWNETNGADFDSESNGLVAGLTAAIFPQLTADAFYSRTWDRYDNLNSLAGPGGFAFRRIDDVDRVTAQLTWWFFDWLRAFVRYDYIDEQSNIRFFNFDQNSYSGGIVLLIS